MTEITKSTELESKLLQGNIEKAKEIRELRAQRKQLSLANDGLSSSQNSMRHEINRLKQQVSALQTTRTRLKERIAETYTERARVLAVLSVMFDSIILTDTTTDHNIRHNLVIDFRGTRLSFNLVDLDMPLFQDTPRKDVNGTLHNAEELKNIALAQISPFQMSHEEIDRVLDSFAKDITSAREKIIFGLLKEYKRE